MRMDIGYLAVLMALVGVAGCAGGGGGGGAGGMGGDDGMGVCDLAEPACAEGLVCEAVVDGEAQCVGPVVILGMVLDLADDGPIEGALVQAVDANGAAVGTTGVTASDGTYMLTVPAMRDEEGNPVEGNYTLRVQAAGFQEFPTAIRPALPVDVTTGQAGDEGWSVQSALTTIGLIALPGDVSNLGSIVGTIEAEIIAGLLVVAEGEDGVFTGFSDSEGNYVIFNVEPGGYTVQGYAAGVQLDVVVTAVEAGQEVAGVNLVEAERALSTVSGSVQIVNASGEAVTSVVLALESTFDETAGLGKVPPGLRAGEVTGAFSIEEVPDGRYVVLAAFENDGLVRDPDQNIGGTQIVRIEVPDVDSGNVIGLSEGFKVTGALGVVQPGADGPQQVDTLTPTLEWDDDSSEDGYEIRVLDAFGNLVWQDEIESVSGSATIMHPYAGPALESGMYYQFRVTSFRERGGGRTAISTTEDLRGVFFYLEPEILAGG